MADVITPFEINWLRYPWTELPLILYRVYVYDGSARAGSIPYRPGEGLRSTAGWTPRNITELKDSLEIHLNRRSKWQETPYISTFRSRTSALNWAEFLRIDRSLPYELITIELRAGDGVRVIHLGNLLLDLEMEIPHPQHHRSEYLILHSIPKRAIVKIEQSNSLAKLG